MPALEERVVRERYVDARELAEQLHVSLRTVRRWVQEGMPSRTWGMRVRRFRLSECERWLEEEERDRVAEGRSAP